MSQRLARTAAAGAAAALALGGLAIASPATATEGRGHGHTKVAHLDPLNNSGASGHAAVSVKHDRLGVRVAVTGLSPNLPHAQHIHYGEQARHECPTFRDDKDRNFRVNVAEGVPQYGPIAVSLTTTGDTSPASGLALDRMPVANTLGAYDYQRYGSIQTSKDVAKAIERGEGVVVVHGIDYNQNGTYDLAGAGPSELDTTGKTPAEATDPALCGVLRK